MITGLHRHTVVRIEKKAIFDNLQNELNRLPAGEEIFAVVKADGYGHGAVAVAEIARNSGVTGFCVAIIDEALELRAAGINEPIIILGLVDVRYVSMLAEKNISVAVDSISWLEQAQEILSQHPSETLLPIHLAIDSGMGRIGFTEKETFKAAEKVLAQSSYLYFEGAFTHFATADEKDTTYFEQQAKKFNTFIALLTKKPKYIHSANSATSFWHEKTFSNIVRFGIGMYGLNPSGGVIESPYPLRPALSLVTELVHVKQMHQGEKVGYGATYETTEGEWIGTLPIGYADGWRRKLQGMNVLVEGEEAEIVGRICMDQCMIRLKKPVQVGTEVILIGKSGEKEITVEEIAKKLETIHYEVICGLAYRLPRQYD